MAARNRERRLLLHRAFELSIAAKALFALVETLSGIGLFLIRTEWVLALSRWLTASELSEDPADALARWALRAAESFSVSTQHFWALYLLGHGAVKLLALGALVSGWRGGYPLSIMVLVGFIVLQMHRFVLTHSALMLGLTVFDLFVIWLIWQEYRSLPAKPRQ